MGGEGCRNTWELMVVETHGGEGVETHEGEGSRNTWEMRVVETHRR